MSIQNLIVQTLERNGKLPSKSANYLSLISRLQGNNEALEFIKIHKDMPFKDFFLMCRLGIDNVGNCIICNKNRKMFTHYNGKLSNYCSNECSNRDVDRVRLAVKTRESKSEVEKESTKEKRRISMLEKYGVEYNSQRDSVKSSLKKTKLTSEKYSLINDKDWLYDQYIIQEKTFEKLSSEYGFDKGTIGAYLKLHNIEPRYGHNSSQGQRDLAAFIESLGLQVSMNNRTKLIGKEIDIFVPEKNFGIEYDGLYYHGLISTATSEEKKYHQKKVLLAESLGVNLIRITEEEWLSYPNLVKSMIKARLGASQNKISARNCYIKSISASEARNFFDRTHIGGFSSASHYIALTHNASVVMVCSFSKSRFDKKYDWELVRMSSELDTIVIGGFQKILKYFRNHNPGSIMTYADRRYSFGNSYIKAGFKFIHLTDPGYVWTDGTKVYSRYQTQKSKLEKLIKNYDPSKTENENMFANRFRLYYDCGHLKYYLE